MTPSFSLSLLALQGFGGGAGAAFLFQIAAIFGIFYFLLIRPQQKQRREHEARLKALKRGDKVITSGGVVGEIVHLKEATKEGETDPSMDDEITIKSGESRLIIERRGIARVASA